jgi:cation diffusion facilitator CzcD-associated flavoprotein CzcO
VGCQTDPIQEVTEKGVRTASGEIELDMITLATGYVGLTGALRAFDMVGRNGHAVNEHGKSGARSRLGLMMPGFPNLFMTTGPNGPAVLANLVCARERARQTQGLADVHGRLF